MKAQALAHLTNVELVRLLRDSTDPVIQELVKRLDELLDDNR